MSIMPQFTKFNLTVLSIHFIVVGHLSYPISTISEMSKTVLVSKGVSYYIKSQKNRMTSNPKPSTNPNISSHAVVLGKFI